MAGGVLLFGVVGSCGFFGFDLAFCGRCFGWVFSGLLPDVICMLLPAPTEYGGTSYINFLLRALFLSCC